MARTRQAPRKQYQLPVGIVSGLLQLSLLMQRLTVVGMSLVLCLLLGMLLKFMQKLLILGMHLPVLVPLLLLLVKEQQEVNGVIKVGHIEVGGTLVGEVEGMRVMMNKARRKQK